jgi:hypothetical protein
MAGERAEKLRRTHTVALALADVSFVDAPRGERLTIAQRTRTFYLGLPDARLTVALSVMFVPAHLSYVPLAAGWNGWFHPSTHYLSVQARERAGEQSNALLPVDNVYGSPTHPIGNVEDLYGWLISGEPDAREWRGSLVVADWVAGNVPSGPLGRWVATATFTSHAEMTADEWRRVADRIYLRGETAPIELYGYPG